MPSEFCPEPSELLARLTASIAPDDPVGCDPRDSSLYEAIRSEASKTSDKNWQLILESSHEILTRQGKDLVALGYLLQAAAIRHGWSAAAAVTQGYAALLRTYGDALHPRRERARRNALLWLGEERVTGSFERIPATAADLAALGEMDTALSEMESLVGESMPDAAAKIAGLRRVVANKKPPLRSPEAPAATIQETSKPESCETSEPHAAPTEALSKGDLGKLLQKTALGWISLDPESPVGYKLLRTLRWQEITTPPRSASLAPPHPRRIAALEELHGRRAWDEILSRSETAFTEPGLQFWLDLQHHVVAALSGRGLKGCAEAVQMELKALLVRVPQLPELTFSDGTPLATPVTRGWLDELCRETPREAPVSAAFREDDLESDLIAAKELASTGAVAQALELLQGGIPFGDLRHRTLRQLAIAKFALLHGKLRPALHLGQELAERCFRLKLLEWDPLLATEIVDHQLRALSAAIAGGLGDPLEWARERELLAARFAPENPALFARLEF